MISSSSFYAIQIRNLLVRGQSSSLGIFRNMLFNVLAQRSADNGGHWARTAFSRTLSSVTRWGIHKGYPLMTCEEDISIDSLHLEFWILRGFGCILRELLYFQIVTILIIINHHFRRATMGRTSGRGTGIRRVHHWRMLILKSPYPPV